MDASKQLATVEEVRRLKARYFRYVDSKDWSGLSSIFAEDIVFDRTYGRSVRDAWSGEWVPPLPPEPQLVRGRDAVVAMIKRALAGITSVHHGHMPEIDVTGPDQASAIWAMSDELRDREGRLIVAGRGHYHDFYRLTHAGWRIAKSKLTRLSLVRGDGRPDQGEA